MAYAVSTSITDHSDLMAQVLSFATTYAGFTQDEWNATNKYMSLHRGNCYVHFWWDDTSGSAFGSSIGMYQSLGYAGPGVEPWQHTTDSQSGSNAEGNMDRERGIKFIGDGPFTSLHMFGNDDAAEYVVYCVLEFAPGLYRHFGFGQIAKNGTWTGGEWCGGHHWNLEDKADVVAYGGHSILLDGGYYYAGETEETRVNATMRAVGLPNQSTENTNWCVVGHIYSHYTYGVDGQETKGRDGNIRSVIGGGIRKGVSMEQYAWLTPNLTKGYLPIIPIDLWYQGTYTMTNGLRYYLGRMVNIGMINLTAFDPAQEVTVGSDTWMVFPAVRKSKVSGDNQESKYIGIIYKK